MESMDGGSAARASSAASRTSRSTSASSASIFFCLSSPSRTGKRKFGERVAMGFFFALFGGFVELFVVGQGVRVRTDDVSMNQRGAAALADVVNGFLADGVSFQGIGAVEFGDGETGKTTN